MRRRLMKGSLIAAVLCLLAGGLLAQESRRFRPIPIFEKTTAAGLPEHLPPLPTRELVEAAAHRIAESYATDDLMTYLAEDFPNKDQLMDTIRRTQARATGIRLFVESIESVQIGPWQMAAHDTSNGRGTVTIQSVCMADVRTRLTFDRTTTGERVVHDVGRAQWMVRFSREVTR